MVLLMKIGGGNQDRATGGGIHWHMNIANDITYIATDSLRQTIPWVRFRNRQTGEQAEYTSLDATLPPDELLRLPSRTMDCIDCHNRPSHIYRSPVRIVDRSLATGKISTDLPNVRAVSVQALAQPYSTHQAAMDSIPVMLHEFYQEQYPEVAEKKKGLILQAAEELKTEYDRNFFPGMKVSWKAYPNNIGHMTDAGCFRCHDGKHVDAKGTVISKDCNTCHTILFQGKESTPSTISVDGMEFQHPEDIGDLWKETLCNECHSGE